MKRYFHYFHPFSSILEAAFSTGG